jgi:DNA-binding NarL/FixJ family response regulator
VDAADELALARASYEQRAWEEAFARFTAVDRSSLLGPDDLERLAAAAFLAGREADSVRGWERAHRACMRDGPPPGAARAAWWIAFVLLHRGEPARAGGWLARAGRVLDAAAVDCVERGYLLYPAGLQYVGAGDLPAALELFEQAEAVGTRFGDTDLVTLALHALGRIRIMLGEVDRGIALLDEAMVAVVADEVSPILAGDIYCSVIEACHEIFDLRRASEWTQALDDWCRPQPDLVPYRGQCLVHRSELLQLHGAWGEAMTEAERARRRLSDPPGQPALGMAHYQQAELHRIRGAFTEAEEAYGLAVRHGHPAHPGLALLRLFQGRHEAAEAAIRHVVVEVEDRVRRPRLLASFVEIVLASGDVRAAREAADELAALAAALNAPALAAMAAHASGAVQLAEGQLTEATSTLRRGWALWWDLEAPYEAARIRVLLALAFRAAGDLDTAELELEEARRVFRELGAGPDLARATELARTTTPADRAGLTAREFEVLKLVSKGRTNRQIAERLMISEKTVARHLSNLFTKLQVSSRSAATAYAYEHDLVEGRPRR